MKEWSVVLFGHEYLMAARSYAEAVRQVWELFDECGIDPEFQSALPRGERHQFSPKSSLLS